MKTKSTAKSLREVLINSGWTAEWEAIGEAVGESRKALDIAQNMINAGFPPETITSLTGVDIETVKNLPATAQIG